MKFRSRKKIITTLKQIAFGGEAGEEQLSEHLVYNDSGWVIEEHKWDTDGFLESNYFSYDASGNLISQEFRIEKEGFTERLQYNRDEKGRVMSEQKFYGDDEGENVLMEYLAHNAPVKIIRKDADGELETTEYLTYDSKDLLTEHLKHDAEQELVERTVISYDDSSNPVTKTVYDATGEIKTVVHLDYDSKNNPVRIRTLNGNGKLISEVASEYDDAGRVVVRRIRDFNTRTLRFDYDETGNCVVEEIYDENDNLVMRNTTQFDENQLPVSGSEYYLDTMRGADHGNLTFRFEYEMI